MWIKTQGGYLLNMDHVEYIDYDSTSDITYCHTRKRCHGVADGNVVQNIRDSISLNVKIMEVC